MAPKKDWIRPNWSVPTRKLVFPIQTATIRRCCASQQWHSRPRGRRLLLHSNGAFSSALWRPRAPGVRLCRVRRRPAAMRPTRAISLSIRTLCGAPPRLLHHLPVPCLLLAELKRVFLIMKVDKGKKEPSLKLWVNTSRCSWWKVVNPLVLRSPVSHMRPNFLGQSRKLEG